MELGQKVQIVGRFDMTQEPDAVKMEGEVIKVTPKRIKVRETSAWSVFEFDRETLKGFGSHWVCRPIKSNKLTPEEKMLLLRIYLASNRTPWSKSELMIINSLSQKKYLSASPKSRSFTCTKEGAKKAAKLIKQFKKAR
jgi:hypothetical protein